MTEEEKMEAIEAGYHNEQKADIRIGGNENEIIK